MSLPVHVILYICFVPAVAYTHKKIDPAVFVYSGFCSQASLKINQSERLWNMLQAFTKP